MGCIKTPGGPAGIFFDKMYPPNSQTLIAFLTQGHFNIDINLASLSKKSNPNLPNWLRFCEF